MLSRSQYYLLAALALALGVSLFSRGYNPYFLDVAVTCAKESCSTDIAG